MTNDNPPPEPDDLRRRAEQLAAEATGQEQTPVPEELPEVLHELRVHQFQLEMQNEALRDTQSELERSRDRYAELYNFAPVGYLTLDWQGRIAEPNLTMTHMLGVDRGRLEGRSLTEFMPHEARPTLREHLHNCSEAGIGQERTTELTLYRRNNGDFPAAVRARVFADRETGQRRFRTAVVDITEQKRARDELQRLNDKLEEKVRQRTAAVRNHARQLRRLAAELSEAEHRERKRLAKLLHDDLQQLLLAVKLRLPGLARDGSEATRAELASIDALLSECLDTSRNLTHELSPAVLSLGTLVEALQWLADRTKDQHRLNVEIVVGSELPELPEHVRVFVFHAVRELLLNVVKHAGVKEARVDVVCCDDQLMVEVHDPGKGFDVVELEQRLEQPEGFGLFSIRERLEALGGRLEIESAPRRGSCFRLVVCLDASRETGEHGEELATAEPVTSQTEAAPAGESERIRVVVADDHRVVREGLVSILQEQEDFEVVGEASDGHEAVARAAVLRPHVVVMDVSMPNLDGVEATRRICQHYPETVVVGLSFHDESSVMQAILDAGAATYLNKDGPADELFRTLRQVAHGG
jgi:PAS domain S-box-containing protein